MTGIDRVTKKYLTECYDAIFYVPSEPCMVNQPIIVNDIPIGVITEATEDYVKCNNCKAIGGMIEDNNCGNHFKEAIDKWNHRA